VLTFGGESLDDLPLAAVENAWDVLEQFGLALLHCGQPREQIRLTIEAVHDSLGADAVYWHGDGPGCAAEEIGGVPLGEAWCRAFLAQMRADASPQTGSLLCSLLDPGSKPMSPWPCSAALIRLGKAGDDWLAALSFHPRRLFRQTDLKIMLLARRMLLNHRVHMQRERTWRETLAGLTDSLGAALDTILCDEDGGPRDAEIVGRFQACHQKLDRLRRG
jgi:hypothetical protein